MSLPVTDQVRIEEDALGTVEVPAEHLWGAQTQRFKRAEEYACVARHCCGCGSKRVFLADGAILPIRP